MRARPAFSAQTIERVFVIVVLPQPIGDDALSHQVSFILVLIVLIDLIDIIDLVEFVRVLLFR